MEVRSVLAWERVRWLASVTSESGALSLNSGRWAPGDVAPSAWGGVVADRDLALFRADLKESWLTHLCAGALELSCARRSPGGESMKEVALYL